MASVITIAFEGWKAQEAASGKPVLLNEFVFANVPNLDPIKPIDRNEKLPAANQIVYRQAVNKAGLASENAVAYSVTLGADVGDFDFNWIGLLNKESGTVAMITHAPLQKKLKTQNGQQGNVLIRSFLLEFQGAAVETQIKTSAETWQIDFTARLAGIDEMQRLINVDSYGAAAFFNDGFEVTRSGEQYTVKKGLGYVGGLRGELAQNQILNNLRNTKVYADFSYQGNIVSQWNTVVKITSAATLANYIDAAGFTHQVFAIASVDASGNVKDLRPMGGLSSQEIKALETRFKLDLSKKIDKANITHQMGNSTELVVSQQLLATELGKKQQAGNYAPAGSYADGNLYKIGNNKLESWVSTPDKTKVFNVNNSGLSGVYDWNTNRYLWGFSADGVMTAGLIPVTCGGTNAKNSVDARKNLGALGVGDYGIGLTPAMATNIAFVDNIDRWDLASGFHKVTVSSKGVRPEGTSVNQGFLLLIGSYGTANNAAYVTQTAFYYSDTNSETYRRSFNPTTGNWSQWAKLYSNTNTATDRNGYLKVTNVATELSDCQVGIPLPWPQATAPAGYLICNGQSFNKTTYPLLSKAYPSGVLPDLRGEFIRGLDAGRNIDSGRAVLSTQGDATRDITGDIQGMNLNGSGAFGDRSTVAYSMSPNGSGKDQFNLKFKASNVVPTANENRPRNIAFLYIVRAA